MRRFMTFALSILLFASNLTAQQTMTTSVPNLVRYSGTIKDAQSTGVVASAPLGVTFAIYRQQEGGAPIWQETQNVTPDANGQYSVLLGTTAAKGLPGDLFSQQEERWLGVQVQGEAEQPRSLLVSVPYAFKAGEADTLGGLPASAFVKAPPSDGSDSTTPTTGATGSPNTAKSGAGIDTVVNCASAKTNYIPVFTSAAPPNITICNSLIYQTGSSIGIGTTTPLASLDVKGAINSSLYYQIGETTVLSIASPADANLFLGVGAGISDVAGQGKFNTFSGYQAGFSNTTGVANTFFGLQAGYSNTTGQHNTILGADAGFSSTGSDNAFVGYLAGSNNIANGNSFFGSVAGTSNTSGSNNTFFGYQAGKSNTTGNQNAFSGTSAGFSNTTGYNNTFSGQQAGYSNTTGFSNTFSGEGAGYSNTTANYNTFSGYGAGGYNTTGYNNTFSGAFAGLYNTGGAENTFSGYSAGSSNTTGSYNTFDGYQAGNSNTTGTYNTFSGYNAGYYNTTGYYNTFSGYDAGYSNGAGAANTYVGLAAGYQNSGNDNIYLGDSAGSFTTNESNTIRLGLPENIYSTFIAGIYGATVGGSGIAVYVDGNGQLGTTVSSRRFKEQIRDMGDSTNALMNLRPVTFFYKPEYDKGRRTLQYGLIAEEVSKVYPELVAYDKDGQPYTVKYQYLATMLLNEVQKQCHRGAAQVEVIKAQQQEIESLRQQLQLQNAGLQERLSRLEKMAGTQVQTVAQK